jgi:hypothetical protein
MIKIKLIKNQIKSVITAQGNFIKSIVHKNIKYIIIINAYYK